MSPQHTFREALESQLTVPGARFSLHGYWCIEMKKARSGKVKGMFGKGRRKQGVFKGKGTGRYKGKGKGKGKGKSGQGMKEKSKVFGVWRPQPLEQRMP